VAPRCSRFGGGPALALRGHLCPLSWWWIGALFLAAVIWFEFIERYLGLESKRVMNEMEEAKKRRIAEALERDRRMPR